LLDLLVKQHVVDAPVLLVLTMQRYAIEVCEWNLF
jgi:hypothetical protein